jgi:hypothetical protein
MGEDATGSCHCCCWRAGGFVFVIWAGCWLLVVALVPCTLHAAMSAKAALAILGVDGIVPRCVSVTR